MSIPELPVRPGNRPQLQIITGSVQEVRACVSHDCAAVSSNIAAVGATLVVARSMHRVALTRLVKRHAAGNRATTRVAPTTAETRPGSPVLDEGPVIQLRDRLLQLGLGVHHDRPVPGDRLLDRLAG